MASAHLRLILNAKTESKADIVLRRLLHLVSCDVQRLAPYSKGGFEAVLTIHVCPDNWATQVLNLMSLAQKFGRGWQLSGDIREEINMTASDFSLPGMSFAHLTFSSFEAE